MKVLNKAIEKYMQTYNAKRLHSAIDYKTPNAPQGHFLACLGQVYFDYINNLDFKGEKLLPLEA